MKTGPDALRTAKNMSESEKYENEIGRPRYCRKMSLGAQNMKTVPDALDNAENESGRAKHENGTRRPRHRRK
jgi:hypothetical protein